MLQSNSDIIASSNTHNSSFENIIGNTSDLSCFNDFVDFLQKITTEKNNILEYRKIHDLIFEKYTPGLHDIVGENFKPILGAVKILDLIKEELRDAIKVSILSLGNEYHKINMSIYNKNLVENVISNEELAFLEKVLVNSNNGAIKYSIKGDNNLTFEKIFLNSYKEYAKKNLENVMHEIIFNVNDIIMFSSTRDIDQAHKKGLPVPVDDPSFMSHHEFILETRSIKNDHETFGVNIHYALKYNVGNCHEMAVLTAVLLKSILEKRICSMNLNANVCKNIEVSYFSTPYTGDEEYVEGCDHAVVNVSFNCFGENSNYILDSWAKDLFSYQCDDDIKKKYSGDSCFTNKNIILRSNSNVTRIINDESYISKIKKDLYEIHKVNLDNASFTDPFKHERERRELALKNIFSLPPATPKPLS
ncbi:hypothetical protein [unidentified bacterial endosymbiont]|uniref:hypothetical protein n=1 Tax=unidentified bacterial endosymbiont TaxID=2355 RepID=UPI00209D8CC2|nr:hypothetical protein [unidentified bacterial endosymbiont]